MTSSANRQAGAIGSADPEISVIIPTFNRKIRVERAIRSALPLATHASTEIIVVDDASQDGTSARLRTIFDSEIRSLLMRLVVNGENLGVTGAKNVGAGLARGKWLIFLDSDDELRAAALSRIVEELRGIEEAPLVFLRCVNRAGLIIGAAIDAPVRVKAQDIASWKWGECLPVVRRNAFERFPYDADLRGFEGLAYMRMMRALGSAVLLPVPARIYDQHSADRLSARANLNARACLLARGYWRTLKEFPIECGASGSVRQCMRIVYYALRCLQRRMLRTAEYANAARRGT